jgi:hypothetical protein
MWRRKEKEREREKIQKLRKRGNINFGTSI